MTKRFKIEQTTINDCIVDNATGEQLDTCDYAKRLCEVLNNLHEENEQLKKENQKLMKAVSESSRMAVETLLPTDEDSLTINGKWW